MTITFAPIAEYFAVAVFALALIHTFATSFFAKLAHKDGPHSGLWHLLAEVEIVFGVWAMVLVLGLTVLAPGSTSLDYLQSRNFTEPLFVFVVMVIAASRPILETVQALIQLWANWLPLNTNIAIYLLALSFVPLLGSFITEPAAMTLAALILRDAFFKHQLSPKLQYATLGVLLVNISIGGTLTPYAAPPVLMVAGAWGWDISFMISHFGWKAAIAVLVNAFAITTFFRNEIKNKGAVTAKAKQPIPLAVTLVHFAFLIAVVVFAHYPVVFLGLFLFFLGFTEAYQRYQNRLILRESLLVAFFLAGLVTLGGLQQWWLQPVLVGMDTRVLFFATTALTAITDNAALTYLGSLVEGVDAGFKYALVAGAVAGGGLTVIANAPNPAGLAILKHHFENETVNPLALLRAAALPTLVAIICFLALPSL